MRIAILGTRGIPNYHGGFEQFAENFAVFLAKNTLEHKVFVYNSSEHPYTKSTYKNVNIIHCNDPEERIGTIGQFIYDYNCIKDANKKNFDIILQLGYTSNAIWFKLLPKAPIIITNMDGLEWKRAKYSWFTKKFLKISEKLALKSSDYLISDSVGIQKYIKERYDRSSEFIAYGANVFINPNKEILQEYQVHSFNYNILIARIEPENNIETILDGAAESKEKTIFLVIGKYNINSFGIRLKKKYEKSTHIRFLGGIYHLEHLNNLRYFSNLYFHGHSVGGTNPSLLEAMASKTLIVAHENQFNKSVLKTNAFYFKTSDKVKIFIETLEKSKNTDKVEKCYATIESQYSWSKINQKYLDFFRKCIKEKSD